MDENKLSNETKIAFHKANELLTASSWLKKFNNEIIFHILTQTNLFDNYSEKFKSLDTYELLLEFLGYCHDLIHDESEQVEYIEDPVDIGDYEIKEYQGIFFAETADFGETGKFYLSAKETTKNSFNDFLLKNT